MEDFPEAHSPPSPDGARMWMMRPSSDHSYKSEASQSSYKSDSYKSECETFERHDPRYCRPGAPMPAVKVSGTFGFAGVLTTALSIEPTRSPPPPEPLAGLDTPPEESMLFEQNDESFGPDESFGTVEGQDALLMNLLGDGLKDGGEDEQGISRLFRGLVAESPADPPTPPAPPAPCELVATANADDVVATVVATDWAPPPTLHGPHYAEPQVATVLSVHKPTEPKRAAPPAPASARPSTPSTPKKPTPCIRQLSNSFVP